MSIDALVKAVEEVKTVYDMLLGGGLVISINPANDTVRLTRDGKYHDISLPTKELVSLVETLLCRERRDRMAALRKAVDDLDPTKSQPEEPPPGWLKQQIEQTMPQPKTWIPPRNCPPYPNSKYGDQIHTLLPTGPSHERSK